ncbi:MAG: FHA domain-containing protein [Planctomycetota bacterium]
MFRLTVQDEDGIRSVASERAEVLVGRRVGVDVCLNDAAVSRNHCLLRVDNGRVVLLDLGSTSGTLVDGKRVREATLPVGAEFRLGKSVVRVDAFRGTALQLAPPDAPPPPPRGRAATSAASSRRSCARPPGTRSRRRPTPSSSSCSTCSPSPRPNSSSRR